MINIQSIDYYQFAPEGQYLDRKSAKKKPKDILKHIVAFANAEGGQLVIGIEDNGDITGFNSQAANSIHEFINIPLTELRNTPLIIHHKIIDVVNLKEESDNILILDIQMSSQRVIKSYDEKIYLRQADQSVFLNADQVIQLEYDRGQRYFEDETIQNSSIDDLDIDIISDYKEKMDIKTMSDIDVLEARNLFYDGKFTTAGILLFGKNPTKYLPQARIKVVKYDSNTADVGSDINIVKEITFDSAIPKLITDVTRFIRTQLREFQYLDPDTGQFKKMPEYPEFAWFEGVVNAVTHRDYSYRGDHIKILLFDDRIEINSPGLLPNIVTIKNIKNTRYSRNPRIARILSEFGWVKEMNEGVKRIYSEMEKFYLNQPTYSEPNQTVLLQLENNIISRHLRVTERLKILLESDIYDGLSMDEKNIIMYMYNSGETLKTSEASIILERGSTYTKSLLRSLVDKEILSWHGTNIYDSKQYYKLNVN